MRANSLGLARPVARVPSALPAAIVQMGEPSMLPPCAARAVRWSACAITLASLVLNGFYLAFLT